MALESNLYVEAPVSVSIRERSSFKCWAVMTTSGIDEPRSATWSGTGSARAAAGSASSSHTLRACPAGTLAESTMDMKSTPQQLQDARRLDLRARSAGGLSQA